MSEAEQTFPVEIRRLGARGDGIAADGLLVAGALPGETVRVRPEETRGGPPRARLDAVLTPSPDRVAPFCPYFGACGGCAIQHLAPEPYAAWKRDLVVTALGRAGIEADVAPLRDAHGAGRRRATFHVRRIEGAAEAGFMAARSRALVPIDHCPITEAALHRGPDAARALARPLGGGGKPLDVQVTATAGGLDVDLRGHGPADGRARQALVALAGDLDLARLSLHGEVLLVRQPPVIPVGRAVLVPPPGGFLQATRAGEVLLGDLVVAGVGTAKRVADLFSGAGAFSLRLAEARAVHAVEGDEAALAALDRAARGATGLRAVTTERRDLFRRPLLAPELDRFDAVVFDPPRAGAEAQAARLAESKVPVVVGVSCDAGTFARDAALLIAGGYRLEEVVPIDQFRHSPHVEVVGVFRREGKRRR
ncbi:class I SAM-dependent RNA methyltransferase [Methylobacterium sp. JK268]